MNQIGYLTYALAILARRSQPLSKAYCLPDLTQYEFHQCKNRPRYRPIYPAFAQINLPNP